MGHPFNGFMKVEETYR